jgi:transcriptional regulator with XRE-family HTH domain
MSGTRDKNRKAITAEFATRLGVRLQDKRLHSDNKMSQEKLAEKIGFSRNHLSKCETGETPITCEILYRYWEEFNFSVDDLFKEIKEFEKTEFEKTRD